MNEPTTEASGPERAAPLTPGQQAHNFIWPDCSKPLPHSHPHPDAERAAPKVDASHAFDNCVLCGAAIDDPEALEPCSVVVKRTMDRLFAGEEA